MTTHRIEHAACCCQDTLIERTALLAACRAATARADATEAHLEDVTGERDRARDLAARLEDQLAQVAIAVENLAALAGLLRGFAPDAAAVLDGATRGLRSTLHPEDGAIVPVDPRLTDQIRAHRKEADSGGLAPENTTPEPPFFAPEIGGAW